MVERHLSGGRPSLDEVASEMGMGRRSFQRMLSAAGTTFHKIVAGKRRLLAREYLRDPALSLTEISCLLGFDDQNSFSRSFRQWEGMSPTSWRARHCFFSPSPSFSSPLFPRRGVPGQRGPRVPCVTPEASAPGFFPACVPDLVNSMSPRPSARRDSVRDDRPGCGVKPAGERSERFRLPLLWGRTMGRDSCFLRSGPFGLLLRFRFFPRFPGMTGSRSV